MEKDSKNKGTLFIVSTPIGNLGDITLRAVDTLRKADGVVCEGFRQASTLLKRLEIPEKKLLLLDEHDDGGQAESILHELLIGSRLALISDCGTPGFEDPGSRLVARCLENDIQVVPVPGASSLMAALSISPLPLKNFYFAGFLPQKKPLRDREFHKLKRLKEPLILMDTPYRLERLLSEICEHLGGNRLVTLALDLTLPGETILHGSVEHIRVRVADRKGVFILIIH